MGFGWRLGGRPGVLVRAAAGGSGLGCWLPSLGGLGGLDGERLELVDQLAQTLTHEHPTITSPPEHPPVCCTQQTITVPPTINAKTAQKHDYPSAKHRISYQRRTAVERAFATLYDPASHNLSRGHCRITGLAGTALLTASIVIARNIRIQDAFNARQAENARRAAHGLPPRQRQRRRQTTTDPVTAANSPP